MTTLTHDITTLLEAALAKPACDTTRGCLIDAMQERDCWTRETILPWVLAHRDNDAPRLLFASWCEQHGEPERGEFVRVQCEIAAIDRLRAQRKRVKGGVEPRRTQLERRERELLPTVARGFLGDILGWHTHCRVINHNEVQYDSAPGNASPQAGSIGVVPARGFIHTITDIFAADWLRFADAIVAAQPIERVRLTNTDGWARKSSCPISLPGGGYPDDRWPDIVFELPRPRIIPFVDDFSGADGSAHNLTLTWSGSGWSVVGNSTTDGVGYSGPLAPLVPARQPPETIPSEGAEPCERCGRMDVLSAFSGYQHDPGESEMLCDDCHETATLEE